MGTLITAYVLEDGVLADLLPDAGVHLVPVAELVDEARLVRLNAEERAAVDQLADPLRGDPPALGDRAGDCPVTEPGPLGRFSGGAGEAALGQLLGGALVFMPLGYLELDPEPVHRAPVEPALDRHPGKPEIPDGCR